VITEFEEQYRIAQAHWSAGHFEAAAAAAWRAHDAVPQDCRGKALLAELLCYVPSTITADRAGALIRLLTDPEIEPEWVSNAGWILLQRTAGLTELATSDLELEDLAARFENLDLALTLLRESIVWDRAAELSLTRLRRWLLTAGQWWRYPRLVDALAAQAALNGGAWPFDDGEHAVLGASQGSRMSAAYLPIRPDRVACSTVELTNSVTRSVAQQYECSPYPDWRRVTVWGRDCLPEVIRKRDPGFIEYPPIDADILVAGCGTGREAAAVALTYPDARVTAIDISAASLRYARQQCAVVGTPNIEFARLDLHNVAELGQKFDFIHCSGVLHHLPDPERGWASLAAVLRAGGVMRIHVYSRMGRLPIIGARSLIHDLLDEPISDQLLRRVRRRLLDHPISQWAFRSRDFFSLSGVHDLLLHRHEDPFDIPRINRALSQLGLRLLCFLLPTPDAIARYNKQFPNDPLHRDVKSWSQFEKSEPLVFSGMYGFWCRKPI
jgi:SAM-dependent methyltransferase